MAGCRRPRPHHLLRPSRSPQTPTLLRHRMTRACNLWICHPSRRLHRRRKQRLPRRRPLLQQQRRQHPTRAVPEVPVRSLRLSQERIWCLRLIHRSCRSGLKLSLSIQTLGVVLWCFVAGSTSDTAQLSSRCPFSRSGLGTIKGIKQRRGILQVPRCQVRAESFLALRSKGPRPLSDLLCLIQR